MDYQVVRRLGRGGMGVVDLATDADGNPVALKRLSLHGTPDEIDRARARIRREAEVLSALRHPAVVRLLDVVDDGDDIVLVMAYLAGGSLHDRVTTRGTVPVEEVRVIGHRLLDALATAHRQGIVHRDIKPANVLFDESGAPHLVDFGVAHARDHTPGLTATSMVVGTPGFMAPEQARGEATSPAADIFSLGATLLYALTGQGPFGPDDADPRVLMHRAAAGRVERPPREVPEDLRNGLSVMLDRNPARRPSAAHLRGGAAGTRPFTGFGEAIARNRALAVAGAAIVAVLLIAGVVSVLAAGGDGPNPEPDRTTPSGAGATTTSPCEPKPYQPCGEDAAANTDGNRCLTDFADYDDDAANGCEAEADDLDGRTLETVLRPTIVPDDDIDTFRVPVDDAFDLTCGGRLTLTLRASEGMTLELVVSDDSERRLGRVVVTGGSREALTIPEPDCGGDDTQVLAARVSPVGSDRAGAPYELRRSGSF